MRFSLPFHSLLLLNIALDAAAWQQRAHGDVWVCGDERLGPVRLPRNFPLSTELATYSRFGDLCPYEFLEKWTYPENGSYHYPPKMGYVLDVNGDLIVGNATLAVGRKVDRFGGEGGNFLAPLGAPYIERSLPPSNLKTFDEKIHTTIMYLVGRGYLRRLSLEEYDEPEEFADNYTPGPNSPTA
ncbi:hypothetical protein CNMCM5793_005953 [Aspergillus hiratsukae]|uniref:TNT domain-containing protein n=1 Tax=Aspergillus hiratsukae TaxID=1194566 RepID=A0A8H6QF56_9EURO|nr:hypothetical protein CNMCM5793_005953 [Aspergillus hiratsukae]KAF7172666.1 hypothetical protein CNMCM6106_006833 [Aspergillus hiratsukae]